jgi:hypothetical protein
MDDTALREEESFLDHHTGEGEKNSALNWPRWPCKLCKHPFSSKRALDTHQGSGACLGKGYICLRCFKIWTTPSDLKKHQSAKRKCRNKAGCTLKRADGGVIESETF